MAFGRWMQWVPRVRPWMVAVALAAGGCSRGGPAGNSEVLAPPGPAPSGRDAAAAVTADAAAPEPAPIATVYGPAPIVPEPCMPSAVYGPPTCSSDEECVQENGAGWYCNPEPETYPDGCGGTMVWGRTCTCCRATGDAADASTAPPDVTADVHKHDASRPPPTYYGPPPMH